MEWPAFWVDPTDDVELSLRRFSFGVHLDADDNDRVTGGRACPAQPVSTTGSGRYQQGHEASTPIGRGPARFEAHGERRSWGAYQASEFAGDVRWPSRCSVCNDELAADDQWQVFTDPVYRRADGTEHTQRTLPAGALFDGWWHPQKGPDGIALVAVLPDPTGEGGDARSRFWHVDGPSRNNGVPGPGWTRTGDPRSDPPTAHVTPSIDAGYYHGFLHCVDGASRFTRAL